MVFFGSGSFKNLEWSSVRLPTTLPLIFSLSLLWFRNIKNFYCTKTQLDFVKLDVKKFYEEHIGFVVKKKFQDYRSRSFHSFKKSQLGEVNYLIRKERFIILAYRY